MSRADRITDALMLSAAGVLLVAVLLATAHAVDQRRAAREAAAADVPDCYAMRGQDCPDSLYND